MRKGNIAAAAALATMFVFSAGSSAMAQTVSPLAWSPTSVTFAGQADVFSTVQLYCNVSGIVVSGNNGSATAVSPAYPLTPRTGFLQYLCPTVEILDKTWSVTVGDSTDGGVTWPMTLSGIRARTTTGGICGGSLTGVFNESTQTLTATGVLATGTASCTVTFRVKPTPALYIAP